MERSRFARVLTAGALALTAVAATPSVSTGGDDAPIVLGEVNTIATATGSATRIVTIPGPIAAQGIPGSISFETDGIWTATMLSPVDGDPSDYLLVTAPNKSVYCDERLPDECINNGLGAELRSGDHWPDDPNTPAGYIIPAGDYWLSLITDDPDATATWSFDEFDGSADIHLEDPVTAVVDDLTVRPTSLSPADYTQNLVEGDAKHVTAETVIAVHWMADAFTVKNDVERTHCFYANGPDDSVGAYTHRCLGGSEETVITRRDGNTAAAPLGGGGDYVIFGWNFSDRDGPVGIGGNYTSTGLNHRVEMGGVWIIPPNAPSGTITD